MEGMKDVQGGAVRAGAPGLQGGGGEHAGGCEPIHTSLTPDIALPVLGSDHKIRFGSYIGGIAPVGNGEFLWLSDSENHRVVRIRDPLTNPSVDVILGQADAPGTKCNRSAYWGTEEAWRAFEYHSADVLCFPGALSLDRHGNLYVSDHTLEIQGNLRLLVFLKDQFPSGNSTVIYAPPAFKIFDRHGRPGHNLHVEGHAFDQVIDNTEEANRLFSATFEAAFDIQNRMVVGYNMYGGGRFVGVYDDPLDPGIEPTGYLRDFWSMPYAATFDEHDNLYIGDINRGRVLVYWNSFNNPAQSSESPGDTAEAPMPTYKATITSVEPGPPHCLLRDSRYPHEWTLELTAAGVPQSSELELRIRKVGSEILRTLPVQFQLGENGDAQIRLDRGNLWKDLWPLYEKVTMTTAFIDAEGQQITNWSPAFLLADDLETCVTG